MVITKETRLKDILSDYTWMKDEIIKINDKFKLLNTPVGKVMIGKATVADMSMRSGMEADELIKRISGLIESHK